MRVGRLEFVDRTLQKIGVLKALSELTLGSGTNILASASTDGATAQAIAFSEGSNSNGRWLRFGGTLQQFGTVTLSFLSINFVEGTWTFPIAFGGGGNVRVFPVLRNGMVGSTPSTLMISDVYNESTPTTTTALLRVGRVTGQTNFVSGDTLVVDVMAVGPAP